MSSVRIGLIGAGTIGRIHAKTMGKAKGAELAAIVDVDEGRAESLAKEHGLKKFYTDYLEMLEKESPDAVFVATPNYLHAKMTTDSLSRGAHVFCEKPIAMNAAEAQAMIDAKRKYGKMLMLGMVQRFTCEAETIREVVRAGTLGNIYYTDVTLLRRMGIPGMRSWFTTKEFSGGGPLADIGPHALDLALWVQDFPRPVSAKAYAYSKLGPQERGLGTWGIPEPIGRFDVEDLVVALVELENGGVMSIQLSWALYTIEDTFNCILSGEKAGASVRPPKIFTETSGKWTETSFQCPQVDPYLKEIQHFVDCITESKEPMPRPEQGLVVMKVIDAIYKSASTHKEVPVQ